MLLYNNKIGGRTQSTPKKYKDLEGGERNRIIDTRDGNIHMCILEVLP
jgi:hypothetical protein